MGKMLFEEMVTFHQYFSPQRVNALLHYSLGFHIPQIFKSVTWTSTIALGIHVTATNRLSLTDNSLARATRNAVSSRRLSARNRHAIILPKSSRVIWDTWNHN